MANLPRQARRGLPVALFIAVATVVLAIIGGGLLWNVGVRRALASDAPGFTVVSGTMESIDFERLRRGRGQAGVRYRPEVEYTYLVGGREYRGRTISALAPEFMTEAEGAAWFEGSNVRVGGPVDVFHDPANPGRSVLLVEPGAEFEARMKEWEVGGWVCAGLAVVGAAATAVLGVVWWGGRRGRVA